MRLMNLAVGLVCFLLVGCHQTPSFHTSDGAAVSASTWRGKWLVVNYWATWCEACREEIPQLNEFSHSFGDRVQVLGVNFDHLRSDKLQAAVQRMHIGYPVIVESLGKWLHLHRPAVLPATYLINPKHRVVQALYGPTAVQWLRHWSKRRQWLPIVK